MLTINIIGLRFNARTRSSGPLGSCLVGKPRGRGIEFPCSSVGSQRKTVNLKVGGSSPSGEAFVPARGTPTKKIAKTPTKNRKK